MLTVYNISRYVQLVGSILILISCLPLFNRRSKYIKALMLYALASILFSITQEVFILFFSNVGMNAIGNGSVLSEAIFFSVLFFCVTENNTFKNGIILSIILYIGFYITSLSFTESSTAYSFIRFGRDSLMIFYALAYFYFLIKKLPEENLLKFPMFWINSIIIFFFSGTFILSLMIDYIVSVLDNDLSGFWAFRNFFRFLFCMVLSYAAWLDWRLIKSEKEVH